MRDRWYVQVWIDVTCSPLSKEAMRRYMATMRSSRRALCTKVPSLPKGRMKEEVMGAGRLRTIVARGRRWRLDMSFAREKRVFFGLFHGWLPFRCILD